MGFPFNAAAGARFLVIGIGEFSLEDGVEGVFKGFACWGAGAGSGIIELASVGEVFIGIEEVEFGGTDGVVGFGNGLVFVEEVGEREASGFGFVSHHEGVVFWVAIGVVAADCEDGDAFALVFFADFFEFWVKVFYVGAVVADEHDEVGLVVCVVIEIDVFLSCGLRELEGGGDGAQRQCCGAIDGRHNNFNLGDSGMKINDGCIKNEN